MSPNFILSLIILLGGLLRFYKLDWGEGYFFHPDEYHIATSVNQLSFPLQMNPHLFSYGSFISYLVYFTKLILGTFSSIFRGDPSFLVLNPILIGRFYSALFSTLTIILIYFISLRLFNVHYSLFTAALCATMPGLIQQAHFATPESILTFWLFLTLYLWIKWLGKKELKFLYLASISLGLALGTKIVALTFLPILILLPVINQRFELLKKPVRLIKPVILPLMIVFLTFFFVFPYSFLDWPSFRNSMNYEIGVGQGKPIVFYTRQFINTTPIIFQLRKILPYALGPGILILGTIGGVLMIKNRRLLILPLAFAGYFFPNAFLFAKWTRFIAPIFPFFTLFTTHLLKKIKNKFLLFTFTFFLFINLLWTLLFFSIYLQFDVRITATSWINQNLSPNSFILTESGNMLEVPLRGNFQKFSFDFYHLEERQVLHQQLPGLLVQADYFIVQSRRIFVNHQRLPERFPKTSRFYHLLFSEQLGLEKIKEFNSYPFISDEFAEETWSVFDHPVIRIYKKTKPLLRETYEELLKV